MHDHGDPHSHAHSHAHDGHGHAGHAHAGQAHGVHGHAHALGQGGRVLAIGIVLNLAFVAVEWVAGYLAQSLALMADATHNLGDALGLVLAWGAVRLSQRAPTPRFTWGLGASSILAALANGLLLVLVTGGLAWEAVQRLQHPQALDGPLVIAVALAGVAVNGITAWLLHAGHEHDLNMRGAYLHMVADAAVSVGVAIAGVVVWMTSWLWVDPVVTLVVGLVIVVGTWGLLRDATRLALHAVPRNVELSAVRDYLAGLPQVSDVHDLHIWATSTTSNAMSAHVVCPAGHPGDAFLDEVAHEIEHRFGIPHVTLQVELGPCGKGC